MSLPQDPLSRALRTFLQNQIAGADRLHFATLPQPVRSSQVTDRNGTFDQSQANELFSRDVADSVAILDGDVRQPRQGSFADLLRYGVIEAARFFSAPDRSEVAISRDRATFEAVLAEARERMEQAASLAPIPATFVPSRAIPGDWCDPANAEGWSRFTQTVSGGDQPKGNDPEAPLHLPNVTMPLIIRRFSPDLFKIIPRRFPLPFDPGNVDPIPDFPARAPFGIPHHGWSDWSALRHPTSIERFASLGPSNPLRGFDTLGLPLGSNFQGQWRVPTSPIPGVIEEPIVKIDDLKNATVKLLDTERAAVFDAHVIREGIEVAAVPRNSVDVTLEYMAVRIERPWIFQPLFTNTNWYVPDMRRGQVSRGEDDKTGIRDVAPEAFLVVRNVRIRADFSNADAKVLSEAFAIGPFGIDREATVVGGELTLPGMQIIAYIDADLPTIPSRSDPNLLV